MGIARNLARIIADNSGAISAANLTNAPNPILPGTIAYVGMNSLPTGWLKANGALVSRTTYAALFSAIGTTYGVGDGSTTFALPDLRGEFIRAFDDGRGIDSGRSFGSAQTDAMQGHYHDFTGYAGGGGDNFRTMVGYSLAATLRTGDTSAGVRNPVTNGSNGTPRTASETRGRNIALLACIKF